MPSASQRTHWNRYEVGAAVQRPAFAPVFTPTCGVPALIVGGAVFAGTARFGVTAAVGGLSVGALSPVPLVAITRTRNV